MTAIAPHLTPHEQKSLLSALNYFSTSELAFLTKDLGLPSTGQRHEVISRIYRFLITPTAASRHNLPDASRAKEGAAYPLRKETLILKGSYQTNAATKNFLKKLAGEDFYFSPSSQDWIALQWQRGKPPTYGEFAQYFKSEKLQKEQIKVAPPEDWAYETFKQQFMLKAPMAREDELAAAWERLRVKQQLVVHDFIHRIKR